MRWSNEETKILLDNYRHMPYKDIQQLLSRRSVTSITHKIFKLGLIKKIPRALQLDFSDIDTEEKAYILGMWSADGYVIQNKGIGLSLQRRDKDILIKIRDIVSPESPIREIKERGNSSASCGLNIYSTSLIKLLSTYGFTSRKTKTVRPPSLQKSLIKHFIRGLFDGDGHVALRGKNKTQPVVNIAGNVQIISFVHSYFNEVYPNNYNVFSNGGSWGITYTGNVAWNFLKCIYEDATLYMNRKYVISISILNKPEPERKWRWNSGQDKIIRQFYSTSTPEELITLLPNKTWKGIQVRASRLGVKRRL